MADKSVEETGTGISYATWQDRQLAAILARTAELLRELRQTNAGASRNEELSRELGRVAALLEIREAELRKIQGDAQFWQAKAAALGRQVEQQAAVESDLRAKHQQLQAVENDLRAGHQQLQE